MTTPYKVKSIDWRDDEWFVATTAYDADDAVHEWAAAMDADSGFTEGGYPDNHEVVVLAPDGTLTRHLVCTDLYPAFYVYDKDPVA